MLGSETSTFTKDDRRDDESKQAAKPTAHLEHLDNKKKMKYFKADNRYEQLTDTSLGIRVRRNQETISKTSNGQRRHICRVLPIEMKLDDRIDRAPWETRVYLESKGICDLFYTQMKSNDLDKAIKDGSLFSGPSTFTDGRGMADYEGHTKVLVISSDTPFACRTSTLIKKAELDKLISPTKAMSQ